MNTRKKLLSSAMAAALGIGVMAAPMTASADIITLDWDGLFTMTDNGGGAVINSSIPYRNDPTWLYGRRTQITGTMTFDTATGAGSSTVNSFSFLDANGESGFVVTEMNLEAFGDADTTDGDFQDGSLVLVNMLFNWNGTNGIPVSLVLDAAGFFAASGQGSGTNIVAGDVIDQANFGFATPATDSAKQNKKIPIGGVPISTTSWDTTPTCGITTGSTNNGACLGVSPIGGFPLLAGASGSDLTGTPNAAPIGGSPMMDGPFAGSNANFDITSMTVTNVVSAVPVPAAVWLFGSGLVGLAGVAARRKR